MKILIVDDSTTARTLIKKSIEICSDENIEFLEAKQGKQALELLKNQEIDLVFTDLNMPEMDGMTLLKKIKASPRLHYLPVIIITSLKNQAAEQELMENHAFAVLQKPLKLPEVHQVLQHFWQTV